MKNLLTSYQPEINKIYLYTQDPYEAKYQLLIDKCKGVNLKRCCSFKAFIEYLNDIDDIYKNIKDYNLIKEFKILIVLDNMISDMLSIEKRNLIVTELFIAGRKPNISLGFITQSYLPIPKKIRLHFTQCFLFKVLNKQEFQQITFNSIY